MRRELNTEEECALNNYAGIHELIICILGSTRPDFELMIAVGAFYYLLDSHEVLTFLSHIKISRLQAQVHKAQKALKQVSLGNLHLGRQSHHHSLVTMYRQSYPLPM